MFARIDHIGVAVESIDDALKLYDASYEMTLVHREVVEERRLEVPNTYLLSTQRQPFEERRATPEQVEAWALETEPAASQPSGAVRGGFTATIVGALSASRAETISARLREAGYPAQVAAYPAAPAEAGSRERKRYQVRISGLDSQVSAARIRGQLRTFLAEQQQLPAAREGERKASPKS